MGRMPVDTFINMNNERGNYFSRFSRDAIKARRLFIPSMTIDEANDFCGFDDEAEIGTKIYLPAGNDLTLERQQIKNQTQYHRWDLIIIGECSHECQDKVRHHPDYSKPLEVELLCHKCHGKRHAEINIRNKHVLINMISIKMLFSRRTPQIAPSWLATYFR